MERSNDGREDASGEDSQWTFALDDVDENGIVRPTLEPGSPELENVVFVLLGAVGILLVLFFGV